MEASRSFTSMETWCSILLTLLTITHSSLTGSVQWTGQLWKTSGPQSTPRIRCCQTLDLDTTGMDNHGLRGTGLRTWRPIMPLLRHPPITKLWQHHNQRYQNLSTTTSDKLVLLWQSTMLLRVVHSSIRTLIRQRLPLLWWTARVTKFAWDATGWS